MRIKLFILGLILASTQTASAGDLPVCHPHRGLVKLPGLGICLNQAKDPNSACICDGLEQQPTTDSLQVTMPKEQTRNISQVEIR